VSVLSGSWAGMAIRLSSHSYYYLEVNPKNGNYQFEYHDASNGGNDIRLRGSFSNAVQQETSTPPWNTLLLVAQTTSFHIYLNGQSVDIVMDNHFQGSGNIALVTGSAGSGECTVAFRNAEVWVPAS